MFSRIEDSKQVHPYRHEFGQTDTRSYELMALAVSSIPGMEITNEGDAGEKFYTVTGNLITVSEGNRAYGLMVPSREADAAYKKELKRLKDMRIVPAP